MKKAGETVKTLANRYLRGRAFSSSTEAKTAVEQDIEAKSQPPADLSVCVGDDTKSQGKYVTQCPSCEAIVDVEERTKKGIVEKYCSLCGRIFHERA